MGTPLNTKPRILLVDDDFDLRTMMAEFFDDEFDVVTASSGTEALAAVSARAPEAVVTDVRMPEMSGIEFLATMRSRHPELPIIIVSGFAEKDMLLGAVRHQAFDFFEKPIDHQVMTATLHRAVETYRSQQKLAALRARLDIARTEVEQHAQAIRDIYAENDPGQGAVVLPKSFATVLTQNSGMRARLAYCAAIASTSLPVLVTGETGTGKDVLARAIHEASGRKGTFVAANIGGLDDALLADTLFGHVPGAYTHAEGRRQGLIEAAEEGTLFLDEIGDLSPASQVKLLRLLESGDFYPLGSDTIRRSTARIIAATHRDITDMVARGSFRSDLFFRLKSHLVELPPLRERKDDMTLLFEHFLGEAARQLGKPVPTCPKELLVLLVNYRFPGNLRELRGMIFDALSRHKAGVLSMRSFQEKILADTSPTPTRGATAETRPLFDVRSLEQLPTLREAEDLLVEEALRRAEGNQAIAARMLGLTRQALNKRLVREQQKKVS